MMMRQQGVVLQGVYRQSVLLPRPDGTTWSLQLKPLRLGFQQWLRERGIVQPAVPLKLMRDSQGRVMRDAEGLVLTQRDESDTEFRLQLERYHQRLGVLMVWESLQADDQLEFETAVPDVAGDWNAFAEALAEEMDGAGFTAGDLIWLCEQIAAMSNLAGEHLRGSQQRFFREEGRDNSR